MIASNKTFARYKNQYIEQFFKVVKTGDEVNDVCKKEQAGAEGLQVEMNENWQGEETITKIEIYTDGSCISNGKKQAKSAYAFQIYVNDFLQHEQANVANDNKKTNQRAELLAILEALKYIRVFMFEVASNPTNFVTIYSDSEYSIKCITEWCKNWDENDWAKKKNTDLLRQILGIYNELNISFKHVRAHTGASDKHSERNAKVDQLARAQI